MDKINNVIDYLEHLKTYYPEFVVDRLDVEEICASENLSQSKCKRLQKKLGEDFFTKKTAPLIPNADYQVKVPLGALEAQSAYSNFGVPILRDSICETTIDFKISEFSGEEADIFSGAYYARGRMITKCRFDYQNQRLKYMVYECEAKSTFSVKGMVKFDPVSHEVNEFMILEEDLITMDPDCPYLIPPEDAMSPLYMEI